jgi:hypothetical protein
MFNLKKGKMKNLKVMMMTLMMCLITMVSFGQDRVNTSVPKIQTQINSQILKSKGWLLNPEGQWISRQNRIPSFIENQFKSLIDYEKDGLGIDNFISYQFRDVKIGDSLYTILIKRYKDGYYKYSSIKEGWTNYNSVLFYVFSRSELDKFKNIKNDSINQIKISVLYSNSLTWVNDATYISDIEKELVKQINTNKEVKDDYVVFHIAPYKDKNIVQFQIYTIYSKYKIIGGIIKEHKVKDETGKYSWENKQIYETTELFKYCYYEVDYLTFSNFIKLIK